MKGDVKTDKLVDSQTRITLTESGQKNVWYHERLEYLFTLTARGFKMVEGTKKELTNKLKSTYV